MRKEYNREPNLALDPVEDAMTEYNVTRTVAEDIVRGRQRAAQAKSRAVCCGAEPGRRRVVLVPETVPMFRHPLSRWS